MNEYFKTSPGRGVRMATLRGADSKTLAAPCWPASYLSLVQPRARALPTNEGEDAAQKKKSVALYNKKKESRFGRRGKAESLHNSGLKYFYQPSRFLPRFSVLSLSRSFLPSAQNARGEGVTVDEESLSPQVANPLPGVQLHPVL